ncbi:hypothetical protein BVI1335_1010053 [Burkholderia vietnamiensis]|nr:hypothetical protein BVI1335_1010053 [Burkholderia vietnamiensis]
MGTHAEAAEAVRGGHVGAGCVERDARAARHLLARRGKLMQTGGAHTGARHRVRWFT